MTKEKHVFLTLGNGTASQVVNVSLPFVPDSVEVASFSKTGANPLVIRCDSVQSGCLCFTFDQGNSLPKIEQPLTTGHPYTQLLLIFSDFAHAPVTPANNTIALHLVFRKHE